MPLTTTDTARVAFLCAGTTCLGLGVIGAFLPVLPTTPFVLLAAACFARGSTTWHNRLLASRFGPTIRAWQDSRSLPRRTKRHAYLVVPLVFALSILAVDSLPLQIALAVTAGMLLVFLHRLPTAVD